MKNNIGALPVLFCGCYMPSGFRHGNYVGQIVLLVCRHISPLYVIVCCWDLLVRCREVARTVVITFVSELLSVCGGCTAGDVGPWILS